MGEGFCSRCGQGLSASHGVFLAALRQTCFNFLLATRTEELADCLDSLEWPAAVIAPDHSLLLSNDLLGEGSGTDAEKPRIGEILDCVNAALLGRCGETMACFLCGIRKSIEHTLKTGERLFRYQTSVQKRSGANQTFMITTEKAGGNVLLIIEVPSEMPRS